MIEMSLFTKQKQVTAIENQLVVTRGKMWGEGDKL